MLNFAANFSATSAAVGGGGGGGGVVQLLTTTGTGQLNSGTGG